MAVKLGGIRPTCASRDFLGFSLSVLPSVQPKDFFPTKHMTHTSFSFTITPTHHTLPISLEQLTLYTPEQRQEEKPSESGPLVDSCNKSRVPKVGLLVSLCCYPHDTIHARQHQADSFGEQICGPLVRGYIAWRKGQRLKVKFAFL